MDLIELIDLPCFTKETKRFPLDSISRHQIDYLNDTQA